LTFVKGFVGRYRTLVHGVYDGYQGGALMWIAQEGFDIGQPWVDFVTGW
jgi:hypothetical protein